MDKNLAKLIALKKRVDQVLKTNGTITEELFQSLRDQFYKEKDLLSKSHTELTDFKSQNYEMYFNNGSYDRWAGENLIGDINYFIDFKTSIETIQIPNLSVTEEGIYFTGQHFDALLRFNEIISKAKTEVILIDNYIDEKILGLLSHKDKNVQCRVLTLGKTLTANLQLFIGKFNSQYGNLVVKASNAYHDRFVILDKDQFYHFGASIKDAGKKGFMFSRIDEPGVKKLLLTDFEANWI